jgi:hypothetical protein
LPFGSGCAGLAAGLLGELGERGIQDRIGAAE